MSTEMHSAASSPFVRLWNASGIDGSDARRLLARLARPGTDWADLYFQETTSRSWTLEEGILKSGSFTIDRGVGLRCVSGEKSALAYTSDFDFATLSTCADRAGAVATSGREAVIPAEFRLRSAPALSAPAPDCDAPEEQIALLKYAESKARSLDPRVEDVHVSYQTECDRVIVAGLDGRLLSDERPLSYLSITVQVCSGGRRERASAGGGGRMGIRFFTRERVDRWVQSALDEALHNLDADPAPAGVMPVVLGPGWPGILLHESVGHGLESDFIRKGTSVFTDMTGERVASPGVTVIDDGTLPGRRGSLHFDDEGEPTQRTVLIEDGILTGFMHDLTNARLLGAAPTGNGRRESFATLPLPRMTNTFMLAGPYDPQEIVASVDRGIYASHFNGGQVDITNGQFVFNMSRAWMIEKGRITRPVKGAMLIGSGSQALRHIPMIGNDFRLDEGSGQCGKDGQHVPVGVGMPTVRIDALTVGGTLAA